MALRVAIGIYDNSRRINYVIKNFDSFEKLYSQSSVIFTYVANELDTNKIRVVDSAESYFKLFYTENTDWRVICKSRDNVIGRHKSSPDSKELTIVSMHKMDPFTL